MSVDISKLKKSFQQALGIIRNECGPSCSSEKQERLRRWANELEAESGVKEFENSPEQTQAPSDSQS